MRFISEFGSYDLSGEGIDDCIFECLMQSFKHGLMPINENGDILCFYEVTSNGFNVYNLGSSDIYEVDKFGKRIPDDFSPTDLTQINEWREQGLTPGVRSELPQINMSRPQIQERGLRLVK